MADDLYFRSKSMRCFSQTVQSSIILSKQCLYRLYVHDVGAADGLLSSSWAWCWLSTSLISLAGISPLRFFGGRLRADLDLHSRIGTPQETRAHLWYFLHALRLFLQARSLGKSSKSEILWLGWSSFMFTSNQQAWDLNCGFYEVSPNSPLSLIYQHLPFAEVPMTPHRHSTLI